MYIYDQPNEPVCAKITSFWNCSCFVLLLKPVQKAKGLFCFHTFVPIKAGMNPFLISCSSVKREHIQTFTVLKSERGSHISFPAEDAGTNDRRLQQ